MQLIVPDIEKSKIRVNPDDILKLLGAQEGAVGAHSKGLVDQYIDIGRQIMSPAAGYVLVEAMNAEFSEELDLAGISFQTGKIINKMLKSSEIYALFIVTIGPEPEQLARNLLEKGEYLDGYITDLLASAMVDSLADLMHDEIRKVAQKKGMKMTNRYSPGYCSWDVSEQQKLFSLFPKDSCGISLSESSLMNPIKSISGIIGLGPQVKYNDYTCEICPMKTCAFRKPMIQ